MKPGYRKRRCDRYVFERRYDVLAPNGNVIARDCSWRAADMICEALNAQQEYARLVKAERATIAELAAERQTARDLAKWSFSEVRAARRNVGAS